MNDCTADDNLVLKPDDDGQLFVIRVLNSGEERVARYCYRALNGRELRFPMFYDANGQWKHGRHSRVLTPERRQAAWDAQGSPHMKPATVLSSYQN